jgi:hypothetical protein
LERGHSHPNPYQLFTYTPRTAPSSRHDAAKTPSSWNAINRPDGPFSSRPSATKKYDVPSRAEVTNSAAISTPSIQTKKKKKKKKKRNEDPSNPLSLTPDGTHGATPIPSNLKSSNRKLDSQPTIPPSALPNRKRKHILPLLEVEGDNGDSKIASLPPAKRKKSAPVPDATRVTTSSSSANPAPVANEIALAPKPTRYRRGQAPITQSTSTPQAAAKGKYTAEEFQLLDNAVSGFQNTHGLSREDLAKLIAGQPNESTDTQAQAKTLWDAVADALPYRPRQSLQKCARRKYHTGRRGKFTKEEDEAIIEAHEMYKNCKDVWVKVGQAVNRSAPDVRDRFRNNLIRPDKQRKDVWDGEEEALFISLFEGQLETARKAHADKVAKGKTHRSFDEQNFYPNMEIIEKKMEYTRGNLQLRNKFHKIMKRREQNRKDTPKDPSKKSGRVETAESHFKKKMKPGDKYRCLKDILTGVIRYKHNTEDRIPWSEIQQDYKASGGQDWGTPERKVVYKRMKVLASTNPKDSVADILKAEILYMENTYTPEELAQCFDGKRRKGQPKNTSTKPSFKSSAVVRDDDSGEQVDSDVSIPSVGQKLLTSRISQASSSGASSSKSRAAPKQQNDSSISESSSESEQDSNVATKAITTLGSKSASGRSPSHASGSESSRNESDDDGTGENAFSSLVAAARSVAASKLPKETSTSESSTESDDSSDEE